MNPQQIRRPMPKWMVITFAIEIALALGFLVLARVIGGSYPMPSSPSFQTMIPLAVPLALVGVAILLCRAALRRDRSKMAALWTVAPLVATLALMWAF